MEGITGVADWSKPTVFLLKKIVLSTGRPGPNATSGIRSKHIFKF